MCKYVMICACVVGVSSMVTLVTGIAYAFALIVIAAWVGLTRASSPTGQPTPILPHVGPKNVVMMVTDGFGPAGMLTLGTQQALAATAVAVG